MTLENSEKVHHSASVLHPWIKWIKHVLICTNTIIIWYIQIKSLENLKCFILKPWDCKGCTIDSYVPYRPSDSDVLHHYLTASNLLELAHQPILGIWHRLLHSSMTISYQSTVHILHYILSVFGRNNAASAKLITFRAVKHIIDWVNRYIQKSAKSTLFYHTVPVTYFKT